MTMYRRKEPWFYFNISVEETGKTTKNLTK